MCRRIVAALLLSCCACQAYTPISVTPSTGSQDVRVTLTSGGVATSYGGLGSGIASVEGRLKSVTDSSLSLSVTSVTRSGGDDEARAGEDVTLARGDIASVERKQTSVPRSLLVAGAVVGGALLVARSIGGSDQSGGIGRGGQPGQQ